MTAIVTRGDAANLLLPDETVDLIVTSPPYFGLRSYQDGGEHYEGQVGDEATPTEYLDALIACTAEWMRVLKPGGSIFVNLGDKYAADNRGSGGDKKRGEAKWAPAGKAGYAGQGFVRQKSLMLLPQRYAIRCIDELGLILRAEIVWAKPNGLPESVTDRVRRSHEQVFHFVKLPRYYSAVDEVREEAKGSGRTWDQRKAAGVVNPGGGTRGGNVNAAAAPNSDMAANPLGKLPGSVWNIPTSPLRVPESLGIDHFACVDDQTEILTKRGWRTHDRLSHDDWVAGVDPADGEAIWTPVEGIHRYDYDGDLVAVEARGLSMRLTPNHRTLVHRFAGSHRTRQPVEVIRADELTKQHAIPRSVQEWVDHGWNAPMGVDMAALAGWVAAEGWIEGKRVRLSQSATANPQHVATIDALLSRIDPWAKRSERQRTQGSRNYLDVSWQLSATLAEGVLDLMPLKLLPPHLTDLPIEEARALLEAFIAGDGHDRPNGRRAIFQKFRHNLDVLQGIAVRCGYNTTLSENGGRWVLYLNPPRPARLRRSDGTSLVGREHYKGTVWCVTTGTGTFIARRRGTVFVTGNSYPPELVRRIVLGWSPRDVCTACGEGRRPVSTTSLTADRGGRKANVRVTGGHYDDTTSLGRERFVTVTGYACACPDNDAPATPGVVLDPFGGTGTTALVASAFGRVGISVDLSADYCRLARWRTTNPGERARVLGVPKPEPVAEGQMDMFGEWTA